MYILLFAIAATGCASVTGQTGGAGRNDIEVMLRERGLVTETVLTGREAEQPVSELPARPLSVDDAVQLAVRNSPAARKIVAELTLGAADIDSAAAVRNPVLSFASLDSDRSGARDLQTLGLFASLSDLITVAARRRAAGSSFAGLQRSAGADLMTLATETAEHYFEYSASVQIHRLLLARAEASRVAAELATQFHSAGNISARQLAEDELKASEDLLTALDEARRMASRRAGLADALGISTADDWKVAPMVAPRAASAPLTEHLRIAGERRLDLLAALDRADAAAGRAGVADWSRWIGDMELGLESERDTDGERSTGPGIALELPLFGRRRAEARAAAAELELAALETVRVRLAVANEVHTSHAQVQVARAGFEEIQDRLLPAAGIALQRAQEEQNFMLIGVFELIDVKNAQYDAYRMLIAAARDYWLAETSLAAASGGLNDAAAPAPTILDISPAFEMTGTRGAHQEHGEDRHRHHGGPVRDTEEAPTEPTTQNGESN